MSQDQFRVALKIFAVILAVVCVVIIAREMIFNGQNLAAPVWV